jgi:membrane protein
MVNSLKAVFDLFRDSVMGWSRNEAPFYAAALAYYTIFSLAPLLIISTAIAASIFNQAAVEGRVVELFEGTLGPDIALLIQDIIKNSYNATSSSLATVIGVGVLLYGASTIFYKLRHALNAMWGIVPDTTAVRQSILHTLKSRLLSAAAVLVVGILLLGSLLFTAFFSAVPGEILDRWLPNFDVISRLLTILASPLVFMIVFAIIFETLPNAKIRWRDVWPGAALTAILFWIGGPRSTPTNLVSRLSRTVMRHLNLSHPSTRSSHWPSRSALAQTGDQPACSGQKIAFEGVVMARQHNIENENI